LFCVSVFCFNIEKYIRISSKSRKKVREISEYHPIVFYWPGNDVKMYGVHVESKNENQNSRCWQDMLSFE
jgi:hypothetical protein